MEKAVVDNNSSNIKLPKTYILGIIALSLGVLALSASGKYYGFLPASSSQYFQVYSTVVISLALLSGIMCLAHTYTEKNVFSCILGVSLISAAIIGTIRFLMAIGLGAKTASMENFITLTTPVVWLFPAVTIVLGMILMHFSSKHTKKGGNDSLYIMGSSVLLGVAIGIIYIFSKTAYITEVINGSFWGFWQGLPLLITVSALLLSAWLGGKERSFFYNVLLLTLAPLLCSEAILTLGYSEHGAMVLRALSFFVPIPALLQLYSYNHRSLKSLTKNYERREAEYGKSLSDNDRAIGSLNEELQRLKEEEEMYRALSEGSSAGSYISRGGRIVFVNKGLEQLTNMVKDELLGEKAQELINPSDRIDVLQKSAEMLEGTRTKPYRYRLKNKNGVPAWVSETVTKIVYGDGEAVLATLTDITEAKRAEEMLGTLSQSSPMGIYIVQNAELKFVNRQYCEYTGYSEEELVGSEPKKYVHPRDVEEATAAMREMLHSPGDSAPYEYRLSRKDGDVRWVMETVKSIKFMDGSAVLGTVSDITDRRRVESMLRTLSNSSPIGIYIVQDGEFKFVNPEFQKYLGYTEEELTGSVSLSHIYAEDREKSQSSAT